jgi:hypothetical protein
MKKGRCGTMTHDCKRHGTTTLFAALELNRYYAMVVAMSALSRSIAGAEIVGLRVAITSHR